MRDAETIFDEKLLTGWDLERIRTFATAMDSAALAELVKDYEKKHCDLCAHYAGEETDEPCKSCLTDESDLLPLFTPASDMIARRLEQAKINAEASIIRTGVSEEAETGHSVIKENAVGESKDIGDSGKTTAAVARIENRYEKQLAMFPEGSIRRAACACLLNFRVSWVRLGGIIVDIAYGGDYKDWGFESFEAYCARELGLKKPTVRKLMVSYQYLKAKQPERLEAVQNGTVADTPDLDTVAKLRDASDRDDVEEVALKEVEAQVWSGELTSDEAEKKINSMTTPPRLPGMEQALELGAIRRQANKLRALLSGTEAVAEGLKERADEVLVELVEA